MLPESWPRQHGLVLDRLCINNFGGDEEFEPEKARALYFARMGELVRPGGMLIVRDRFGEIAESTFRRLLYRTMAAEAFLPDGPEGELFELVDDGVVANLRLVGDDTDDPKNIDAMCAVRGQLAILRRTSARVQRPTRRARKRGR